MIDLPNGCKCSELAVSPKTWQKKTAPMDDPWHIHYRFYNAEGQVKQVSIRGMNHLTRWVDRRELTEKFLNDELHDLHRGYNPFLKNRTELDHEYLIDPLTPFVTALEKTFELMKVPKDTRANIKSMLKITGPYIKRMSFYYTPIKDVKRRHIKILLDKIEEEHGLSPSNYNHYRAYFMMIFNELIRMETIEINPVDKMLEKKAETKRIKLTLEEEERVRVDRHLRERHYNFWRYMHIFFNAGSRTKELFRLRASDVQLSNQRFKVIIKKGGKPVEAWKPINNIALPLWEELLKDSKPEQFIFSRGLKPGEKAVLPERISKLWLKYVKTGLGIKVDFNSLRHLSITMTVDALSEAEASVFAGHSSQAMVKNIYDTKQKDRQHERLKKINNKFA